MPEYLVPGVYVEETSSGPHPIRGVSTSVAGFVGPTERGPEEPRDITSWKEYHARYGGHLGSAFSYTSYSVQGFFENGGQRCYVSRIASQDSTRATKDGIGNLNVSAIGRGQWGNRVFIRILAATKRLAGDAHAVAEKWFRLQIAYFTIAPLEPIVDFTDPAHISNPLRRVPDAFEDFDNLSIVPHSGNSVLDTVNTASKLVRISSVGSSAELQLWEGFKNLEGGNDGSSIQLADYEGSLDSDLGDSELSVGRRGLKALELVDDISLLLAPDQASSRIDFGEALSEAIVRHCERLKYRFAVLSTVETIDPQAGRPSIDTANGAQYFPWIQIHDPYSHADLVIPPSGHVAGIFARTDMEQGIHKPPANAIVRGVKGLERDASQTDQELLNALGINCLREFRSDSQGIRVWGARTMSSNPEWRYISVRRLLLFLEQSIDEGTQWAVFEPNDEPLWVRIRESIAAFLTTIWRSGALVGQTASEAYFVKCDRSTMSQDDIDNGRLICLIGVAPIQPAEFIIFRILQKTMGSSS